MRRLPLAAMICASFLASAPLVSAPVWAANDSSDTVAAKPAPKSHTVTTEHRLRMGGRSIKYKAHTGTLVINNDKGDPAASVFYVAYTVAPEDGKPRPVTFVFNGGPGSASLWLHMGSFGPIRVATANAKPTDPAPFVYKNNQYSLLDKTDLVFVDAFGTGFSRGIATADEKDKAPEKDPSAKFWGVDEDVDGFARFIERYVTVNQRWNSPKFLLGESYGTTRAPALVNALQNKGMGFNGVILVSSILNYAQRAPGIDRQYIGLLPTFAASAWYHHKLPNRPDELAPFLQKVRSFADTQYTQALAAGQNLSATQLHDVAAQLHQYTGLSVDYLEHANLRVNQAQFRKELLRDDEQTMGRYDARYLGVDKDSIGEMPDTDPSDTASAAAFVGAFQSYLADDLDYHTDMNYVVSSRDAFMNWDWQHKVPRRISYFGATRQPYVVDDLGNAMRTNPALKVFSANGYYDLATPFHATEYDLSHMQLPTDLQKNLQINYYPSGHMIYLNVKALDKLHADLETFYQQAQ